MLNLAPIPLFYLLAALCTFAVWLSFSITGSGDFHRRSLSCPVLTRSRFIPLQLLLRLRQTRTYLLICHATPPMLLACAIFPQYFWLRLLATLCFGAYSHAESSATHSHRDYAVLYVLIALTVLPDSLAEGAALGVCVHFIGSSGLAKLIVGGGVLRWVDAATLGGILATYGKLNVVSGGPASASLAAALRRRPILVSLLGGGTLVFECLIVPAALLLPGPMRPLVAIASLAMHVGIFLVQSAVIGLAFAPNISVYVLGFGGYGGAEYGSAGWLVALSITVASCLAVASTGLLRGKGGGPRFTPIPEEWPLTNFALFAWSAEQWKLLFRWLVDGPYRLVLTTSDLPITKPSLLVGRRVVSKWGLTARANDGENISDNTDGYGSTMIDTTEKDGVYDGWEQCLGETLVIPAVFRGLDFGAMAKGEEDYDGSDLVAAVSGWLKAEERLVLAADGRPLVNAFFVRLREDGREARVAEVIGAKASPRARAAKSPRRSK